MGAQMTQETLDLAKTALGAPDPGINPLRKGITQSTGLVAYNLEAPSIKLIPVITPLRNSIPRKKGGNGTAVHWNAVTGINTQNTSAGVSEGNRGGVITTSVVPNLAAYKGLGLEDYVSYEARYAGMGYEDVYALAIVDMLHSLMIQEERIVLAGNGTSTTGCALGTTPTPSNLATAATGGSIALSTTVSVICVALTLEGFLNSSVNGAGVPGAISRTNADASVDTFGGGSGQKSGNATITTGGSTSTNTVSATVSLVRGAFAYAWYAGTAGAERLYSVTTINSVLITSLPSTTQLASTLPGSDNSLNQLVFDGILPQVVGAGALTSYSTALSSMTISIGSTGGIVGQMATGTAGTGTPLTADGKGGIVEWDTILKLLWDVSRLSPSKIWVNSQEQLNAHTKILTATSAGATRFIPSDQGNMRGGAMIRSYLNKFTMGGAAEIDVLLHPFMPPGTVLFQTEQLPYPASNVPDVLAMDIRQEYYQIDWAPRSRKNEAGVYVDEVLKHYFPGSFAVITNIGNG